MFHRPRSAFNLIELLVVIAIIVILIGLMLPAAQQAALGGTLKTDVAHTGWTEGQTFQTGLTFVFSPNTQVPFTSGGTTSDVDYVSSRDGSAATKLSYAAMTSWSFHGGRVVNALLMDGSVRTVKSSIS